VGLAHSPRIVTDGLVLALDGANYKSFKGEATTNEFLDVTWAGDGTNQTGLTKGATLVTNKNFKYRDYTTYLWTPGSSRNCYLNGNGVDISTSRTSTVWTFSCYVKREDGAAITSLNVYMYYPSSDGSASGTIESVGNGWYRVSRTRTGTDSYISLAGFTGFTAGYRYYLSGPQLEKKSYATAPTEVDTTRGTTVATGGGWKDLVGSNNGEIVNGVRESTDGGGCLVFDGTDDKGTFSSPITASSNQTYEVWTNAIASASANLAYAYILHNNSTSSATGNSYLTIGIKPTQQYFAALNGAYATMDSGVTASNSNIVQIVLTWDGSTQKMYINGDLKDSEALSTTPQNFSTTTSFGDWRASTYRMIQGNIYAIKIYNRALSASEIQQNFNALRGRFGI